MPEADRHSRNGEPKSTRSVPNDSGRIGHCNFKG